MEYTDGEVLDWLIAIINTDGSEMTDGECLGAMLDILLEWERRQA